jgi:pyruvate/2-oxoglutarate dehydrogenase complex dihydrolipoamide dehydrogenase (E3) component
MAEPEPVEVDVVVLGMGVGGEEVAGRLAEAGLSVVGVEDRLVGGECPYYACVPTKMMLRAAELVAEARRVDAMAGTARVEPDFGPVARRIRDEATDDWDDRVAVDRFVGKGGRFVRGVGRFDGPGRVRVGDDLFLARRGVVVATGSAPVIPPIPGLAEVEPWTNREAVRATAPPASLAVLGGGAVGVEFAQAFARFGSRVTVVEAMDRILPTEEPEAGDAVATALRRDGVEVHSGRKVTGASAGGEGAVLDLDDGGRLTAERVLVAVGRRPNLADLDLARVGLEGHADSLPTDGRMRVAEGIWALGDVAGHGMFTHVAVYHARIIAADILGAEPAEAEYRGLAWVTFTEPEVGRTGMTERQARDAGIAVRVGRAPTPANARGWIHGPGNDGLVKIVADADRDVLVGATAVGPVGGEVLAGLTLAVHAEVPIAALRTMHYAYPTFHRAVLDAVGDLG